MKISKEFEKLIKRELGVNLLPLRTTTSSGTNFAALECDENGKNAFISIKENYEKENELDLIFFIVHEMRHFYQIKNGIYNFKDYKTREELNLEDYNSQPEEIDANAFACFFMEKNYNRTPLFKGFSEELKQKIYKHKERNFK